MVISILFSYGKSHRYFKNLLAFDYRQSIRCFKFFSLMGNLTFVLRIFWSHIVRNLSVVSILLSNGKSNRCFNTCLALHCKQSIRFFLIFFLSNGKSNLWFNYILSFHCRQLIRRFHFSSQMENQTVVSTMFRPWIAGNLSVVSVLFSNGKSNRCFNNFLTLHGKQSIHCFNSFVKWKIELLLQQFF